jgi:hypothetical protein
MDRLCPQLCLLFVGWHAGAASLPHRYRKSLNRLLKVCYVSATSAVLKAFFSSFLLRPLTVLIKQTMQPVRAIKQSIYLDVYGLLLADVLLADSACT